MPKELSCEERSVLSWELARLCRAGLSWQDSVALLSQRPATPALGETLAQLGHALEEGQSVARAFAQTGRFPGEYLRQLEVGQTSGRLDQVLEALAAYDQRESETSSALRQAVTYPLTMIALIGGIFFFLGWKVLPIFNSVFAQLGVSGPGEGGRLAILAGSVACVALALFLLVWLRTGRGMALFGRGAAGLSAARARFASALAMLLQSGTSLDEAMERCAAMMAGTPLQGPAAACQAAMLQGEDFDRAVVSTGLLDSFLGGLLAAGLRSGGLPEAMEEIARRCSARAQEKLTANLGRFEYALVLFLCGAVAAILLSVMLPLVGMLSALGG